VEIDSATMGVASMTDRYRVEDCGGCHYLYWALDSSAIVVMKYLVWTNYSMFDDVVKEISSRMDSMY